MILKAVAMYSLTKESFSLNSATYFVTPASIPPVANDKAIVEKLFNCPTRATPAGPIMDATTLTLTRPVHIRTNVDIDVREKTFTISALATRFTKKNVFWTMLAIC